MPSAPTRRDIIKLTSLALVTSGLGCGESGEGEEFLPDGGFASDAGDASPLCPATGSQTAGPFYPGEPEVLMDIVGDRVGVPLQIELTVLASGTCDPIVGAEVDVWTADSNGDYSGYATFGTEGEDWLRGQQITGTGGAITIRSIVPGAYPGRAVHVHIKVRAEGASELTTQLYFPDEVVADVLAEPEYQGASQTDNGDDGFYAEDTLMEVSGDLAAGFVAVAVVHV